MKKLCLNNHHMHENNNILDKMKGKNKFHRSPVYTLSFCKILSVLILKILRLFSQNQCIFAAEFNIIICTREKDNH